MVAEIPCIEPSNGVCDGCVLRNHNQESFPKNKMRQVSRPIVLIHSHIHGHVAYTLIEDFSYFLWVYTIKYKDEVFGDFREF
jgi:hypothetical protein